MTGRGKPNPRRANGNARDKLVARVKHEESLCWLCGKPVDKTLPHGLDGSPEIDEIVPVSRGGSPFDRNNCRLSHRKCNRDRSNGPREEKSIEPLTTTRRW